MASDIKQDGRKEIRQILKNINDAWVNGQPEKLGGYFHDNMVIAGPDFRAMGKGKQSCVKSYKDFTSQAAIRKVKESDYTINIWGDTVVASYKFELYYEMNGQNYHDCGYDLFVFAREEGNWRAVWRSIFPLPERK